MAKYWIFRNHGIAGPFSAAELLKMEGFNPATLIAKEGEGEWREASHFDLDAEKNSPVFESGDFTTKPSKNWRDAIVDSDVEPSKFYTSFAPRTEAAKRPAEPEADPKPSPESSAVSIETEETDEPRSWLSKVAAAAGLPVTRRARDIRESVALLALSAVFLGVYYPQTDQVNAIMDTLIERQMIDHLPYRPMSFGLRKPRSMWSRLGITNSAKPVAPAAKTVAVQTAKAEPIVDEIETELGDGMIMKTVTIVSTENGVRKTRTRSFVIQPLHKKAHSKKH